MMQALGCFVFRQIPSYCDLRTPLDHCRMTAQSFVRQHLGIARTACLEHLENKGYRSQCGLVPLVTRAKSAGNRTESQSSVNGVPVTTSEFRRGGNSLAQLSRYFLKLRSASEESSHVAAGALNGIRSLRWSLSIRSIDLCLLWAWLSKQATCRTSGSNRSTLSRTLCK